MKQSEALDKFAPAFAKAQGAIEGALKDKTNPAFRSKYADLGACWEACREELSSNGISVIQASGPSSIDGVMIITRLLHASGQWVEDDGLYLPASKKDAQGFGSAITYARRYGLCAMVGIAPEDDDGNSAARGKQQAKPQQPEPKDINPSAGVLDGKSEEEQLFFREQAAEISAYIERDKAAEAVAYVAKQGFSADEFAAIWQYMAAPIRSKYKAAKSLSASVGAA